MDGKQYLDPFSKSIRWGLVFLTIGLLVLFSFAPLSNERRSAIIALVLLVGFVGLASVRYLVPKLKPNNALGVYGGITFHCISIAAGEYILSPLDISALYIVRIIASAMLWDRKAALFTALFATFLTVLVNSLRSVRGRWL
jgi:hypothetical protein